MHTPNTQIHTPNTQIHTPNTQIHDRSFSTLGTGTSIKRGEVKLDLWAQTSTLSEIVWSCK